VIDTVDIVIQLILWKLCCTVSFSYYWLWECNYKKLIRRWDSERELFYDDVVHVLQNTEITL